jgi:hypothetical protein
VTTPAEFVVGEGVAGTIGSIEGRYMHEGIQWLDNAGVKSLCSPSLLCYLLLGHSGQALGFHQPSAVAFPHSSFECTGLGVTAIQLVVGKG